MSMVGLALVGVLVGAAGAEFLRATKPDSVKRLEESARRFVDRLGISALSDKDGPEE